jgi:hypothetical protein
MFKSRTLLVLATATLAANVGGENMAQAWAADVYLVADRLLG